MTSEIAIQSLFRSRCRIMCPRVRVVAVPNGTHIASHAGRAKAKREGLASGFPDVLALWPGRGIAAIEFKAAKGRLSENQAEWLDWLTAAGIPATVSRDPDHAVEFLRGAGAPFIDRPHEQGARPIGEIVEPIIGDVLGRAGLVG